MLPKFSSTATASPWKILALLALAVAALYGHTLNVPWYFDDHSAILENPRVQDLGRAASGLLAPRGVAIFSFAINYAFAGQAVSSYHLTNIVIHLLCACLVYRLLRRILGTEPFWPLLGALLFLAHPLQTQAVTYVVQRMASLAALFFLLAIELFLCFREERAVAAPGGLKRTRLYYAGALLAGILAVFSKENTAVLPLALILLVRCFDQHDRRWRPLLLSAAPFLLPPLVLAATFFIPALSGRQELATLSDLSGVDVTPWHYLATQFQVFWIYLRLLLLPYGQTLDYGYPLVTTFWNAQSLLALLSLLALGWGAWRVRKRWPVAAFGLGWFFLTLAVESSVIPLDTVFEHRLYLPMLGFIAALLGLAKTLPWKRPVAGGLLLLLGLYGVLTWQRNALWNDPLAFSVDNVEKKPFNDRAFYNLAVRTINNGDPAQGIALLQQSLQRFPQSCPAYLTLADMAKKRGQLDEGMAILQQALANCTNQALVYNNLGFLYGLRQQTDKVLECLDKAREADPHYAESYFNTARILAAINRLSEAENFYRDGFRESRRSPDAYIDYARLLERLGRRQEALEAYRTALQLEPDNPAATAGLAALR